MTKQWQTRYSPSETRVFFLVRIVKQKGEHYSTHFRFSSRISKFNFIYFCGKKISFKCASENFALIRRHLRTIFNKPASFTGHLLAAA